jgi:selenocysteine lyase/cysteine desulfurase
VWCDGAERAREYRGAGLERQALAAAYAVEVMKRLGLEDSGGAVRAGIVHYNTADEVDRLLAELERV